MTNISRAVVCPIFNEDEDWQDMCRKLLATFDLVVVVDDGSKIPVVEHNDRKVIVLRHSRNRGKGRALETGFRYCLERDFQFIATIDGDGEHAPENFADAIKASSGAGLVCLSRHPFFGTYDRFRNFRNTLISARVSKALGIRIKDTQSGMRLFSAPALRVALSNGMAPGYAVETTMLWDIEKAGFVVREVPMQKMGATRAGKKYACFHTIFSDLRLFLCITLFGRPPHSQRWASRSMVYGCSSGLRARRPTLRK